METIGNKKDASKVSLRLDIPELTPFWVKFRQILQGRNDDRLKFFDHFESTVGVKPVEISSRKRTK
jgi:hypothetical protein